MNDMLKDEHITYGTNAEGELHGSICVISPKTHSITEAGTYINGIPVGVHISSKKVSSRCRTETKLGAIKAYHFDGTLLNSTEYHYSEYNGSLKYVTDSLYEDSILVKTTKTDYNSSNKPFIVIETDEKADTKLVTELYSSGRPRTKKCTFKSNTLYQEEYDDLDDFALSSKTTYHPSTRTIKDRIVYHRKTGEVVQHLKYKSDGKLEDGYYEVKNRSGYLLEKYHILNGKYEGTREVYYQSTYRSTSTLKETATFSNGDYNGKRTIYDYEGSVIEESTYVNGAQHGICYRYRRGHLYQKMCFLNGQPRGEHKTFCSESTRLRAHRFVQEDGTVVLVRDLMKNLGITYKHMNNLSEDHKAMITLYVGETLFFCDFETKEPELVKSES